MLSIPYSKIPSSKKPTYAHFFVNYQTQKEDPFCIKLTFGGNITDYPFNRSTLTCDLVTAKTHWNSVISTEGALYMTTYVKDFYLSTPMEHFKCTQIYLTDIPDAIINKYKLDYP